MSRSIKKRLSMHRDFFKTCENIAFEQVFQLIRSKKVVLWAGSGICCDSSAPMVGDLKIILIREYGQILSDNDDEDLMQLKLSELVDKIIYRDSYHENNRKALLDYLKQYFVFTQAMNPQHLIVSDIPYINQIVTTNYDNLFELSYSNKINVYYNNKSYVDCAKPYNSNLYKIHGDFNDYDSIIISSQDYANFISCQGENLIVGKIKDLLATMTMLFVGFSFEDLNINGILNWVLKLTGKGQHFFVVPNAPKHKIEMLQSKGITYIDSTAEDFFKYIEEQTKLFLLSDLENEKLPYKSAKETTKRKGFIPELMTQNGKLVINGITVLDKPLQLGYKTVIYADEQVLDEYSKFINGHAIYENMIPVTEYKFPQCARKAIVSTVNDYVTKPIYELDELSIEKVPLFDEPGMLKLSAAPLPVSVHYKLYGIEDLIKIIIYHNFYTITAVYKIENEDFKVAITHSHNFSTDLLLTDLLPQMEQYSQFLNSESSQISGRNLPTPFPIVWPETFDDMKDIREGNNIVINFLKAMINIEKYFGIKFSYTFYSEIPDQEYSFAKILNDWIENKVIYLKELIFKEKETPEKFFLNYEANTIATNVFFIDGNFVQHLDISNYRFDIKFNSMRQCEINITEIFIDGEKHYSYKPVVGDNFEIECDIALSRMMCNK